MRQNTPNQSDCRILKSAVSPLPPPPPPEKKKNKRMNQFDFCHVVLDARNNIKDGL